MYELAFTHLGYFLKVASEKLFFFVFCFFLGAAVFVLKLAFVVFHGQSGVLIKLLLGVCCLFFRFLCFHGLVSVISTLCIEFTTVWMVYMCLALVV